MVLVRETVAGDWRALRDIRLEALREAPAAFGSTYEREILRPEAHWHDRIARGGTFLAFVPEVSPAEPAGLIGGYQEDPVTGCAVPVAVPTGITERHGTWATRRGWTACHVLSTISSKEITHSH